VGSDAEPSSSMVMRRRPVDALVEREPASASLGLVAHCRLTGGELPPSYATNFVPYSAIALAAPPATRREPRPTSDSAARRSWRGATATIPWRSGLALALQALDEHSDAQQLVEDELTLARVFVADRAVGIALRARGLLMRGDAAIAGLREAVRVVADSPARLLYARAAG
jgi:hypothetical protein